MSRYDDRLKQMDDKELNAEQQRLLTRLKWGSTTAVCLAAIVLILAVASLVWR